MYAHVCIPPVQYSPYHYHYTNYHDYLVSFLNPFSTDCVQYWNLLWALARTLVHVGIQHPGELKARWRRKGRKRRELGKGGGALTFWLHWQAHSEFCWATCRSPASKKRSVSRQEYYFAPCLTILFSSWTYSWMLSKYSVSSKTAIVSACKRANYRFWKG